MKKISQLGIVFTGLLLTISIIQEPASARPSRWLREGAESMWNSGRRQVDEWRVNPRTRNQNQNRLEQAGERYFQDEKAHQKACRRGRIEGRYSQESDERDNMNLGTFRRSTQVTRYGCRELTDRLY